MRKTLPLFLLLLAAAGCGISDPLLVGQDPQVAALKQKNAAPKGYKVEVAPVELANSKEPGAEGFVLKLDKEAVARETAAVVKAAGVFSDVWYGAGKESMGPDLKLELKVTGATGRYEGSNGNAFAGFIVWWGFSSILGCLVADEDYSASLDVEARLVDTKTGQALWQDTVAVKFQGSLDHYQKGLGFFDLFPPGPIASSHDAGSVTEVLAPHLLRRLGVELAGKMSEAVPAPPVDVCVVLSYDPAGTGLAAADAKRFGEAWARKRGLSRVMDLTGKAGSSGALVKAFTDLAARKDVSVRDLAFYFAGPGTVLGKGDTVDPALVLAAGAEIKVADLLEAVASVKAENRAVVLDAGFQGERGRVVKAAGAEGAEVAWPKSPVGCLCAAGAGHETKKTGGGVLTSFLVKKDMAAADGNGDGKVTLAEANGRVGWPVSRAVRRAGGRGAPVLHGDGVLFRTK